MYFLARRKGKKNSNISKISNYKFGLLQKYENHIPKQFYYNSLVSAMHVWYS